MNDIIKKANKLQEDCDKYYMKTYGYGCDKYDLPELEIGEICTLGDVWDGDGDTPETDYSYKLTDHDWINYEWEVLEEKEDELETIIKIKDICLI